MLRIMLYGRDGTRSEGKMTDASQIKANIVKIKQGNYENVTFIVILINNNNNHNKKVTLIS